MISFENFDLNPAIQKALKENSLITALEIQEEVIPLILEKKDVMAKAKTGSGKTAAFVLPIIELLSRNTSVKKAKIKTLVLTPTRELALQVAQTFETLAKYLDNKLEIVSVIGGEHIGEQLLDIQKGCDIVVATPGRLLDIISKKQIDLKHLEFFVLDEADKMLDLGFYEELEKLLSAINKNRQTLFFSATYSNKVLEIASKLSKNPTKVFNKSSENISLNIKQRAILVNEDRRSELLRFIIKEEKLKKVLVFMPTKRASDNLALKFRNYGFKALSFHGDLEQEERNLTLLDFKTQKINILFSTDIAARGLHIEDISCVVNYELPRSPSDYIHRIGRTGRLDKKGLAISFITLENEEHFNLIEKKCELNLSIESLDTFKRVGVKRIKEKGTEPIKGKRKNKKDKIREAKARNEHR